MSSMDFQSRETLLALVDRQVEMISEKEHQLARRKAVLRDHATRLRISGSPALVQLVAKEMASP